MYTILFSKSCAEKSKKDNLSLILNSTAKRVGRFCSSSPNTNCINSYRQPTFFKNKALITILIFLPYLIFERLV